MHKQGSQEAASNANSHHVLDGLACAALPLPVAHLQHKQYDIACLQVTTGTALLHDTISVFTDAIRTSNLQIALLAREPLSLTGMCTSA
jgi:hypothetical protein